MWNDLRPGEKKQYYLAAYRETAAVKKNEHQRKLPTHKATLYSLVMRLLHDQTIFGKDFLDAPTCGKIAAVTVRHMSTIDKKALVKKFRAEGTTRLQSWSKRDYAPLVKSTFHPKDFVNAYNYHSFADMVLAALGPDAETIFLSLCILGASQRPTTKSMELNQSRWHQTIKRRPVEKRYHPITTQEAPQFERYCAEQAAKYNAKEFPIAKWFCSFRKLNFTSHHKKWKTSVSDVSAKRYQALLGMDSQHEVLERVLSSKERSQNDVSVVAPYFCGVVAPSKYAVIPKSQVLQIAKDIASRRVGKSVYEAAVDQILLHRQR